MSNEKLKLDNAVVLANAVELTSQVIMRIAGNDIANTVRGERVTPLTLRSAVAAKLQTCLARKGVVA